MGMKTILSMLLIRASSHFLFTLMLSNANVFLKLEVDLDSILLPFQRVSYKRGVFLFLQTYQTQWFPNFAKDFKTLTTTTLLRKTISSALWTLTLIQIIKNL